MKALSVIADEKTAHGKAILCATDDCEHVDKPQIPQETICRVVKHTSNGIFGAAHDALHGINRAQVVAAIDRVAASRADKNVLVVIGHANDFMGNNLADGKNEIETALRDEPVHLRWPCIVQFAFRLFADELGWNLAESLDIGPPVVDVEKLDRKSTRLN